MGELLHEQPDGRRQVLAALRGHVLGLHLWHVRLPEPRLEDGRVEELLQKQKVRLFLNVAPPLLPYVRD